MGKGIALEFKHRFPQMFRDYVKMCERGLVRPGVPYCYQEHGRQILNFPTKNHWKAKSRLTDIERGLRILREHYSEWNITSIAVPPLGCGNGGLLWDDVRPLIEQYLGDLPIKVEVYSPLGHVDRDYVEESPNASDPSEASQTQQSFDFVMKSGVHRHH